MRTKKPVQKKCYRCHTQLTPDNTTNKGYIKSVLCDHKFYVCDDCKKMIDDVLKRKSPGVQLPKDN